MAVYDVRKRTFFFAVSIAELISKLPQTIINKSYSGQLIRCSASVEEEADETLYFLELLSVLNPDLRPQIALLINEATELLKIIVAAITTTRSKTM
jgi:hypothetical protein